MFVLVVYQCIVTSYDTTSGLKELKKKNHIIVLGIDPFLEVSKRFG